MVVFGSVFIKEIQRRDRFRARFPVLICFGKTCSFGALKLVPWGFWNGSVEVVGVYFRLRF